MLKIAVRNGSTDFRICDYEYNENNPFTSKIRQDSEVSEYSVSGYTRFDCILNESRHRFRNWQNLKLMRAWKCYNPLSRTRMQNYDDIIWGRWRHSHKIPSVLGMLRGNANVECEASTYTNIRTLSNTPYHRKRFQFKVFRPPTYDWFIFYGQI